VTDADRRAACGGRAALGLLVAVALGCGSRAADDRTVELWAMGREGEVVGRMVGEFERSHPGVHVRVQQIPWSAAHEKLLTAYVGGAMPDLFQAGNTWLAELVALDALEPLDDRLARSSGIRRDDYFPGILDTNVIADHTYGLPWYVDTRLLFYRSDILARAGRRAAPQSWAEWSDALQRVKQAVGADRFAILLPIQEWQTPVILAMQLGAGLLRDRDRYGDFESPAFRKAFEFYLDMFRRGLAPSAGAATVANVYQDFAGGYFSFYVTGPWNLGEFAQRLPPDLQPDWTTAPMPGPERAPGTSVAGGASLAIFRGSPRKEAAWQLVEYLADPERQVEFYRATGDLPPRRSAWSAPALSRDARVQAFRVQLEAVRATPKIPEWEQIASRIVEHAESAIRGSVTVDQALAALDRDVDLLLEKRRWMMQRREQRRDAMERRDPRRETMERRDPRRETMERRERAHGAAAQGQG